MSTDFRALFRLSNSLDMIIPIQSNMVATLPPFGGALSAHTPFPQHLPTIAGFSDDIDILASLQKPKKITMLGSDGGRYVFLVKEGDDLRKDSRLMDLNAIMNRLFLKDSETQKRGLHILTYSVVPLNEKNGLIEVLSRKKSKLVVGQEHCWVPEHYSKKVPGQGNNGESRHGQGNDDAPRSLAT